MGPQADGIHFTPIFEEHEGQGRILGSTSIATTRIGAFQDWGFHPPTSRYGELRVKILKKRLETLDWAPAPEHWVRVISKRSNWIR